MPVKDNAVLNLVEPHILSYWLADRPDLGCAMLIAACKNKNIKIKLIKGQTRYIKDMFLNDSDEIWELIYDFKGETLEKSRWHDYKIYIKKKGKFWFEQELKDVYEKIFINKEPRNFLNMELLNKFSTLYAIFVNLYQHYISELHYYNLGFLKRYISEILKNKPRYIAFSLDTGFDPISRAIRKQIKKMTNLPIIAGGTFTSFIRDDSLDTIFSKEYIDYLIVGPGEYALPDLIETLDHKKEPVAVANVYYKKGASIKTNTLGTIINLDKLPFPDFSQFDLDLYLNPRRALPLQDARGCSWRKCAFCDYTRKYFDAYSTFSIDRFIQTIKYLKDTYNCRYFLLHNDDLPPSRARKICSAIIKHKIKNIFIDTYARLVDGFNDDLLRLMRKAGFCSIRWGLESGSQKVLDLMNKGINIHTASRILQNSNRNKIANICMIIFNFPGESLEDAQKTVKFLKDHARYIAKVEYQEFVLSSWAPIYKRYNKLRKKYQKEIVKKEELQTILRRLNLEYEAGLTKISSNNRYNDNLLLWDFYNSSWEPLSKTDIIVSLHKRKLNKVFPLILGEFKKIKNKIFFYPLNINETNFINQFIHAKEIILDKIEEKVICSCDGYKSIEEIFIELNNLFSRNFGSEYIFKKCINFLEKIYKMNLALGYKRSLRM